MTPNFRFRIQINKLRWLCLYHVSYRYISCWFWGDFFLTFPENEFIAVWENDYTFLLRPPEVYSSLQILPAWRMTVSHRQAGWASSLLRNRLFTLSQTYGIRTCIVTSQGDLHVRTAPSHLKTYLFDDHSDLQPDSSLGNPFSVFFWFPKWVSIHCTKRSQSRKTASFVYKVVSREIDWKIHTLWHQTCHICL